MVHLRRAWHELDDLERHSSLEQFLALDTLASTNCDSDSFSLDLGCGFHPRNPFHATHCSGVDIRAQDSGGRESVFQADLAAQPIPFPDTSLDFVTAFDFLEHIPRILWLDGKTRFCFVELMSEVYRVLKPQGIFLSLTPAIPSRAAFSDPTHVNYITTNTFPVYFSSSVNGYPSAMSYGFAGSFDCLRQGWIGGHLASLLQKTSRQE
jgi:SAM-dependent methyltransferase